MFIYPCFALFALFIHCCLNHLNFPFILFINIKTSLLLSLSIFPQLYFIHLCIYPLCVSFYASPTSVVHTVAIHDYELWVNLPRPVIRVSTGAEKERSNRVVENMYIIYSHGDKLHVLYLWAFMSLLSSPVMPANLSGLVTQTEGARRGWWQQRDAVTSRWSPRRWKVRTPLQLWLRIEDESYLHHYRNSQSEATCHIRQQISNQSCS